MNRNDSLRAEALQAVFRSFKPGGRKIAMLTAYDYPTARLFEEAGIDIVLVGDSLGMVVLGYPDTTLVTLEAILHHLGAVSRAVTRTPVIADLPFQTYRTPSEALANARRLMEAGADAVKLEGGREVVPQIEAITRSGIPLCAHIGMLPQRVREEGGYRLKGKTPQDAQRLLDDALAIEAAGAGAVIMELIKPEVAAEITRQLSIPTVGIGSGPECDGQVLVSHDLIGMFPWFTPKFAKPTASVGATVRECARRYLEEVRGD
ncbi:MAG TPA: 3-methyl-2-oxobutanoate hydroxymethyltransferase [Chthoniobacteraceae bacterium]|nr:3-methyl-2-oxobutanoate hydroxymethyltransferase [Chthoniobacteraceae bacterium]